MGGSEEPGPASPRNGVAAQLGRAFTYVGVAAVVLLLVVGSLFAYVIGSLRPDQIRYSDGDAALQLAHQAMIDQETGLRGYLLLHDPKFLEPYSAGTKTLATENRALGRAFGSVPSLAPPLLDMRVAEQAWISQWASVTASQGSPLDAPGLAAFVDQGKSLFDTYRLRELALRTTVSRTRDDLERREADVIGAGIVLILAAALAAALVFRRQRRILETMLVGPVDQIVVTTERIAQGQFAARVDSMGAAEFHQIGRSVNAMAVALEGARLDAQGRAAVIEEQRDQLRRILEMAREVAGSVSLRYVLRSVAGSAASVSGFPRILIWLREDGDDARMLAAFDTAAPTGEPTGADHAEVGVGVVGRAAKYGRPATEVDGAEPSVEVHPERPVRGLAVPLVVGARVTGVLEFRSPEPGVVVGGRLEVLETLALHAAAAIEASRLHGRAEALANTDGLTSLANRRRLDADLAAECERSLRYRRPLALVMFDVDHFKDFNDRFGHQRGDEVLQDVAATVCQELRATDTAYRYGGEEFVVVARETTTAEALVLAERLRARLESHFEAHGSHAPITASFGVAVFPPDGCPPDHLIATADAAMYEAKRHGRNCVRAS